VTVASDAFTNAQVKPDGLRRGVAFRGEFFAMGDDSIQVFDETGDTRSRWSTRKSPFPAASAARTRLRAGKTAGRTN
jgi:hypothetical protein